MESIMSWKDTIKPAKEPTTGWRSTIKEPEPESKSSILDTAKATLSGVEEGLTMGFSDELKAAGAAFSPLQLLPGFESLSYEEALEAERAKTAKLKEESPTAHMLGDIAGSILVPVKATKGIKAGAKAGATLGGIEAAGRTEADLLSAEGVSDVALGATVGGLLGGAIPAAGKGLKKIAERGRFDDAAWYMEHEGTWKKILKVKDDGRKTTEGVGNFYHLEGVKKPIDPKNKGRLSTGKILNKKLDTGPSLVDKVEAKASELRKQAISLSRAEKIEDLRNPEAFDKLVKSGSDLKVFKSSPTKTFQAIEAKKKQIGKQLDEGARKLDFLLDNDEARSIITNRAKELVDATSQKQRIGEITSAQGLKFQTEFKEQTGNLVQSISEGTPVFQAVRNIRQGLSKRLRSKDYQGTGPLSGSPKDRLMDQIQLFRAIEQDLAEITSTRIAALPDEKQAAAVGDYLKNMKNYSDLADLSDLMGKTAVKSAELLDVGTGLAGAAGVVMGGATGGFIGAGTAAIRQHLSTPTGKFQLAAMLEKGAPKAKQVAKFAKEAGVSPTEVLQYLQSRVGMLGGTTTEKGQTGE
jgi:hypothetical protein